MIWVCNPAEIKAPGVSIFPACTSVPEVNIGRMLLLIDAESPF
jgi:hypothetical protein